MSYFILHWLIDDEKSLIFYAISVINDKYFKQQNCILDFSLCLQLNNDLSMFSVFHFLQILPIVFNLIKKNSQLFRLRSNEYMLD